MRNDFKHSDKHLQKKFEDFSMAAPEGAWAGIESQIGAKTKERRRFFFFWIILLFIGLAGGAMSTYFYFKSTDSNPNSETSLSKNSDNTNHKKGSTTHEANANDKSNSSAHKFKFSDEKMDNDRTSDKHLNDSSMLKNVAETDDIDLSSNKASDTQSQQSNNSNNAANNFDSNHGSNSFDRNQKGSNASNDDHRYISDPLIVVNNQNDSDDFDNRQSSNDSGLSETPKKMVLSSEASTLKLRKYGPLASYSSDLQETPNHFDRILKPKGIWSVEAGIDFAYFNYNYTVAGDTQNLGTFLNDSYTKSASQGGYLRANYQPFRYTSFHAGLELSQNSASQEFKEITSTTTLHYDTVGFYIDTVTQQQIPIVDSSFVTTETEQVISFNNSISQINIPIGVMFHIPVGLRSEFGVNLSGLVNIRSGSKGEVLVDQNGNTLSTSDAFRSVNFSARGAIRYSYLLNERTTIYAEPYFGIGLNNRSNSTLPFTSRFRNSGIRAGFRYSF